MSESHAINPRHLLKDLSEYASPRTGRSVWEIVQTVAPFIVLWLAAWAALSVSYWLTLLLTIPAGLLVLRMFLIQHDCGHGAFFRKRAANDWVGRMVSIFTFTPYDSWRRAHAKHHASSGNLAQRGTGDVDTLTVSEYRSRSAFGRFRYRLYRHPLILLGVGPTYLFLLRHRLPLGGMRKGWRPWLSAMGTNTTLALVIGAVIWAVGWQDFLLVHAPIFLVATTTGVWLFYVQHQFEGTSWKDGDVWSFHDAALHGSSHYALPPVLRWFTANIGIHHIHHLSSRIPFYRLGEAMKANDGLDQVSRITLWDSVKAFRLKLWCDETHRMVSFREAKRMIKAAA